VLRDPRLRALVPLRCRSDRGQVDWMLIGFSQFHSPQQHRLYYFEISVDRIAFNFFTPSLIWFFSNAV
jgi:hypothetical protein